MELKFSLKTKSAQSMQKPEQAALLDLLNLSGVSPNKMTEATYFACLKMLGESVGKLPLHLMRWEQGKGIQKARSHPLYHVVGSHPNPYMTATHCWSTVEMNRNEYGNGFLWIQRSKRGTKLWPLPGGCVQIWMDDARIWAADTAMWYVFTDPKGGGVYKIPRDNMIHVRTSASLDGFTGMAVKDILQDTIEGNQRAQNLLNRSYDNGFTGKAVLQYTGELDRAKEKIYAQKIESYINGEEGLDKVIPMMYGTKLEPLSSNFQSAQFLETKKYSALQIAAAFGIKPNQINDYEKASYASAEAQQLAFYVDTMLYILKQYEEELNYQLLTQEELQQGYFFKFNVAAVLRADQKTQVESLKNAVQGGVYTPNEAREMLDKESKPGGDRLIINGNMVPIDQVGIQWSKNGGGTSEE